MSNIVCSHNASSGPAWIVLADDLPASTTTTTTTNIINSNTSKQYLHRDIGQKEACGSSASMKRKYPIAKQSLPMHFPSLPYSSTPARTSDAPVLSLLDAIGEVEHIISTQPVFDASSSENITSSENISASSQATQEEQFPKIFGFEMDSTWNDFCNDLPMEECTNQERSSS